MRLYKCDVCGGGFDPVKDKGGRLSDWPGTEPDWTGVASRGLDVCKRCVEIAKKVNFRTAMLNAWREAVQESEQEKIHDATIAAYSALQKR